MPPSNPFSDLGDTLKKVASGDIFGDPTPTGADKAASADAAQRARRNPSGIDMAAEAQKAAARAKVPAPKTVAPKTAAPKANPNNSRDHYSPRNQQ